MIDGTQETIYVCECCVQQFENGDTSSCRYYWKHTHNDGILPIHYVITDNTIQVGHFSMYCQTCGQTIERLGEMTIYENIAERINQK